MKKNLLYALILLLAAGLVVYSFLRKKEEVWEAEVAGYILRFREPEAIAWEVNFDDVRVRCEKKKNIWYIVYPEKIKGGQSDIIANVKNFNTSEYISVVGHTNDSDKMKKFKLDRVGNTYTIFLAKSDGVVTTNIFYEGRETGLEPPGYYVRYNLSTNIYHVEDWFIMALRKRVEELREKDFLKIEPETVDAVSYRDVRISKKNYSWVMEGLDSKLINIPLTDYMVHHLAYLTAEKVYRPGEIDLDNMKDEVDMQISHRRSTNENARVDVIKVTFAQQDDRSWAWLPDRKEFYLLKEGFHSNIPSHRRDFIKDERP